MRKKVAVLVGSLRTGSLTRATAKAVTKLGANLFDSGFVEIGDLPLYNPDLDTDAPPAPWARLRAELAAADAFLFATPEYNRSIPAAMKNALDVGSRPYGASAWDGKPAAIISVSPGSLAAFGANHHLRQPLVFLNVPVMPQPEAYVGNAAALFDENGSLINEDTKGFLSTFAGAFAKWIDTNAKK